MVASPLYDASATLIVNVSRGTGSENATEITNNIVRHGRVVRSQVAVLESENVLRAAIRKLTPAVLYPELEPQWLGRLVEQVFVVGQPALSRHGVEVIDRPEIARHPENEAAHLDASFLLAKKSLRVEAVPESDIVRLTFRHGDRAIAAQFLNEIVQAYIDRDLRLSIEAGIGKFFREQQAKHTEIFEKASKSFSDFASDRKLYSIQEQRRLTLARRNELLAALASNESALSERNGQVASLSEQLALMKPVAHLPHIARLPNAPASTSPDASHPASPKGATVAPARGGKSTEAERSAGGSILTKDPPMLLVRVYQDTIQNLVKTNSEIAGLKAARDAQRRELVAIDAELAQLSANEAEFERLRLEVTQAKERVEAYAKRAAAQQAEEAMHAGRLTNIQVVQPAMIPVEASFPKPKIIIALGLISGIVLGLAAALLAGLIWDRPREPAGAAVQPPATVGNEASPSVAQIARFVPKRGNPNAAF